MKHIYRARLDLIDAVYELTMKLLDLLEDARKRAHKAWWSLAKLEGDI